MDHLEEEQVGELLDVVAVRRAVVTVDVAVVPELGDDLLRGRWRSWVEGGLDHSDARSFRHWIMTESQSAVTPGAAGSAFVFVFPFGVERARADIRATLVRFRELTFRVYPPYPNGAGIGRPLDLDYESIPHEPGAEAPARSIMRLVIEPRLADAPYVIADALRVDALGERDDRAREAAVQELVSRFVRLMRLWTRQWWVGRRHEEFFAPLRISFPVDPSGSPTTRDTTGGIRIEPRLKTELLLDEQIFRLVCQALQMGADASFSTVALLDSTFFAVAGDRQRAILDAAVACEALLREEGHRLVASGARSRRAVDRVLGAQPLHNVGVATTELFGLSFGAAVPSAVEDFHRLRQARNALAHGDARKIATTPEFHEQEAFWRAQRAAFDLFEWVANAMPRTFPDPLLAFQRPMVPPGER